MYQFLQFQEAVIIKLNFDKLQMIELIFNAKLLNFSPDGLTDMDVSFHNNEDDGVWDHSIRIPLLIE